MHLCQLVDSMGRWEEVDQFVYDNHTSAIDSNGKPRYNGNRAAMIGVEVSITGTFTGKALAQVIQILNIGHIKADIFPGGFLIPTEFIPLNVKGKKIIRQVNVGTFKAA